MGILENCCFCIGLHAGTVICAIFCAFTSGSGLSWGVYQLYLAALEEELFTDPTYTHIAYCTIVSLWLFHVFTCLVLLISACRNIRALMIPYIVSTVVLILAQFSLGALHLYTQIMDDPNSVGLIPFIIVTTLLAVSIVDIYCLLVVISRWQDLRDDDAAVYNRDRAFSTHELLEPSRNY